MTQKKVQKPEVTQLSSLLKQLVSQAAAQALPQLPAKPVVIERPADAQHGHFATNHAMVLFGALSAAEKSQLEVRSPRAMAERIVAQLQAAKHPAIKQLAIAGPGFINITIDAEFLLQQVTALLQQPGRLQVLSNRRDGDTILVEFTDPNPFKEFHVGHVYSNIVGEAISKLLEARGAAVKRVNYQGDVGMHVAKSLWGLRSLLKTQSPDLTPVEAMAQLGELPLKQRVEFMGKGYAHGSTCYAQDELAKAEMQEINLLAFKAAQEVVIKPMGREPKLDYLQLRKTHAQDAAEIQELYRLGRAWSLEYFDTIYARLGTEFTHLFFESQVAETGALLVREYLKKGLFKESDGAVIFPGEEYGLHTRVFINSHGLPTYESKDLGLSIEKYAWQKYDESIVITGNEIDEYFRVILQVLQLVRPELAAITKHFSHGMVRLPEGKMSSRTGSVITGEWLLNKAKEEVTAILAANKPDLAENDRAEIAERVGLAAVKFALLKQRLGKDIVFSFDESLSFQGFSGPYIQYTVVRCLSILRKVAPELSGAGDDLLKRYVAKHLDALLNILMQQKTEVDQLDTDLLFALTRYFDAVQLASDEYAPHHVCGYVHELAQTFNAWYTHKPVAAVVDQPAVFALRVALTVATARVLGEGLQLLGIKTVWEM